MLKIIAHLYFCYSLLSAASCVKKVGDRKLQISDRKILVFKIKNVPCIISPKSEFVSTNLVFFDDSILTKYFFDRLKFEESCLSCPVMMSLHTIEAYATCESSFLQGPGFCQ